MPGARTMSWRLAKIATSTMASRTTWMTATRTTTTTRIITATTTTRTTATRVRVQRATRAGSPVAADAAKGVYHASDSRIRTHWRHPAGPTDDYGRRAGQGIAQQAGRKEGWQGR